MLTSLNGLDEMDIWDCWVVDMVTSTPGVCYRCLLVGGIKGRAVIS